MPHDLEVVEGLFKNVKLEFLNITQPYVVEKFAPHKIEAFRKILLKPIIIWFYNAIIA